MLSISKHMSAELIKCLLPHVESFFLINCVGALVKGAEEDTWTEEGLGDRRVEKTA
jgi:hypothetical protein